MMIPRSRSAFTLSSTQDRQEKIFSMQFQDIKAIKFLRTILEGPVKGDDGRVLPSRPLTSSTPCKRRLVRAPTPPRSRASTPSLHSQAEVSNGRGPPLQNYHPITMSSSVLQTRDVGVADTSAMPQATTIQSPWLQKGSSAGARSTAGNGGTASSTCLNK